MGLSNITTVNGDLNFSGANELTSLAGLENLTSVTELLRIENCDILQDISALSNLTNVGGIHIGVNSELTDLSVLQNISGSLEVLSLRGNLSDFSAFQNITSINSLFLAFLVTLQLWKVLTTLLQLTNAQCCNAPRL